jgi:hypothetical protein
MLVALPLAVLAGCGHGSGSRAHVTTVQPPVTAAVWKSVLRDGYDGRMNHQHSCSAVEAAIAHLPHDMVSCGLCLRLDAYERRVC